MAVVINLKLDGDGAWPGLNPDDIIVVDSPIDIATLPGGMQSGKPSVAIKLNLPNGKAVIVQTSAELFLAAARAIKVKYDL